MWQSPLSGPMNLCYGWERSIHAVNGLHIETVGALVGDGSRNDA